MKVVHDPTNSLPKAALLVLGPREVGVVSRINGNLHATFRLEWIVSWEKEICVTEMEYAMLFVLNIKLPGYKEYVL